MSIHSNRSVALTLVVIVTFIVGSVCTEHIGLYEESDFIDILDSSNFNEKVVNGNTSYVIEFYNAFCGHCIRFSTVWKEFGLQVYGWRKYVKIGAVDCSNETNSQLCRDYEIMAYPTVQYFSPHPSSNDIGTSFIKSSNVQNMKNNLIQKLMESQSNGNLTFMCDIQPYTKNSLVLDSDYLLTFVIIVTPDDRLAQELIIDYCYVEGVKIIYALNSNTELVELLKTEVYPSIYQIKNNNQFSLLVSGNNKTRFIEVINTELETKKLTPLNSVDITTKLYDMLFSKSKIPTIDTVYLSDLEATLKYSLEHEIVSRGVISGEPLDALKTYLELLIDYFPVSVRGKKFIKTIWENIQNNNTVSGEELRNIIKKYELFLHPYVTKQKWIGCEGSTPMYRRYPCGLWILFHTLTVQASIKDLDSFNGLQVMAAIAGYVKHFFGCTDCSEHFIQMTTSIKNNVSSLDDAVLWLWMAHNQVNQRLAGDVTEDPMYPKKLFPSKEYCKLCRQNGTNADEWNKTEVLLYLKKKYSVVNIKQTSNDITRSESQYLESGQPLVNEKRFNKFDEEEWNFVFNTCMISYSMCVLIIIGCFYLLVRTRCRKHTYHHFMLGNIGI